MKEVIFVLLEDTPSLVYTLNGGRKPLVLVIETSHKPIFFFTEGRWSRPFNLRLTCNLAYCGPFDLIFVKEVEGMIEYSNL